MGTWDNCRHWQRERCLTRESSGQGGSDKGHTEGRTLDPWATLLTVSTGTIRRDGREFVDSGSNNSRLWFRKDGPKIPLAEKKHFLTLSGSVQGNANDAASAHASFADKKQRLTLKEWHDILFLRQVDPAETWPHPNRRYNCCDGHAVHSVPRMKFSSSLLRKRKTKSDNSRGSDSYRPRGTFSPGRDQNEMRSSFRGRSYPRKAHP